MGSFVMGPDNIEIALIDYAGGSIAQIFLGNYMEDPSIARTFVEVLPRFPDTSKSYLDTAFNKVHRKILVEANGDRVGVDDMVVLVTDGLSSRPNYTITAYETMMELVPGDLKILVIGVGVGDVDMAEINMAATNPNSKYTFFVDTYSQLNDVSKKVLKLICKK